MLFGELMYDDDDDDKPRIGFDPLSADFGKIVMGNTRIDPWSGLTQTAVLMNRAGYNAFYGTKSALRMDVTKDQKKQMAKTYQIAGNFLKSKVSPWVGQVGDLFTGTDYDGNPVTLDTMAVEAILPMTYSDIRDAMIQHDVPAGVAMSALAFFGMRMNTYNARDGVPPEASEQTSRLFALRSQDEISGDEALEQAVLGAWYRDSYLPIRRKMLKEGATDEQKQAATKELVIAAGRVESHRSAALRNLRDAATRDRPELSVNPRTYRDRLEKWRMERLEAVEALKAAKSSNGR